MATSSIGQGFNTTTIQSITAYAALINGGFMLEPYVVSQIVDSAGNIVYQRQENITRRVISQQTSDFIRREMQFVMTAEGGTGRRLQVPGHAIAGKTGTAQQGPRDDGRNNHTMIVYTPVENPEYLVLMIIDSTLDRELTSGVSLGPVLSDFMRDLINLRNLPPSDGPDAVQVWQAAQQAAPIMPDYRGMRLANVIRDVNNMNRGGFHLIGEGIAILDTVPAPGQEMPTNGIIFFTMDPDSLIPDMMTLVPNLTGLTAGQAEFFLHEAGLPSPMVHTSDPPRNTADNSLGPVTGRAEEINPSNLLNQPRQVVYRQFPEPGTLIELGTQIMIRVR
jgi:stage V sporulation protein D (sporulation-specific penicillin-binding protein)